MLTRSSTVRPRTAAIVLLCALFPRSTAASMNETLDVSLHASRTSLDLHPSALPVEVAGLSGRLGWTLRELRFGAGAGVHASFVSGEAYVAWAAKGYARTRPYLELRGHVDRLRGGPDGSDPTTSYGLGPRVGVLFPLSEYFFLDVGIGRDLVGPESLRGTIGLGLPIPLSHL